MDVQSIEASPSADGIENICAAISAIPSISDDSFVRKLASERGSWITQVRGVGA